MPQTISPAKSALVRFKKTIWDHYAAHRRSFPWRERDALMTDDAWVYRVVISEIMLQQTQAPRVVEKFNSFMKKFPDFPALARAPLANILAEWQGLGYNRRGVNLKKLAEAVVADHGGKLPQTKEQLIELPSIGPHTAGSVLAFAFNIAEPFIETNIRTVYIHFFFPEKFGAIHDKEIYDLVAKTIDISRPREWFYALMDYGVYLKQQARTAKKLDPSQRSRHYKKQSTFKGSNRELRAELLRTILERPITTVNILKKFAEMKGNPYRTRENILKNLTALEKEGFIELGDKKYRISG